MSRLADIREQRGLDGASALNEFAQSIQSDQKAGATAVLPTEQFPLQAFEPIPYNTLAGASDDVSDAVTLGMVKTTHVHKNGVVNNPPLNTTDVLLALTIPVNISTDPVSIMAGVGRIPLDARRTVRSRDDDDAVIPVDAASDSRLVRMRLSVQMWYTLCTCVMTAMIRMLTFYRNKTCLLLQPLHEDSALVGSPIRAIRLVLRGSCALNSMHSFFLEHAELNWSEVRVGVCVRARERVLMMCAVTGCRRDGCDSHGHGYVFVRAHDQGCVSAPSIVWDAGHWQSAVHQRRIHLYARRLAARALETRRA